MISAHGATLEFNGTELEISYSPLLASLSGTNEKRLDLGAVDEPRVQEPTALLPGYIELTVAGTTHRIDFSPGQQSHAKALVDAVAAVQSGGIPVSTPGTPGFNFVAFDVETANADWGSICQMGAVRFIDGRVTEQRSWLVQPPQDLAEFHPENIAIHGITAEDVADAPQFATALAELVEFVGDDYLLAHNAQFDFTALSRACAADGIDTPECYFACTLLLARSLRLGFENNRLPTLAHGLGIAFDRHHDATADAQACGEIAVALANRENFTGSVVEFFHAHSFTLGNLNAERVFPVLRDRSGAGVALQRTKLGLATEQDAAPVVERPEPAQAAPAAETKRRGSAPWSRVSTPEEIPAPNPDAPSTSPFFEQNVTLSGDFEPYDKGQLWQGIAELGGAIGKNVTKKTTIVVLGSWATKTSKQRRAEELIEKGQDISLWTAEQLFDALDLNPQLMEEEPPF